MKEEDSRYLQKQNGSSLQQVLEDLKQAHQPVSHRRQYLLAV